MTKSEIPSTKSGTFFGLAFLPMLIYRELNFDTDCFKDNYMYRARARYLFQCIWLDTVHTNNVWRRGLWDRGRGLGRGRSPAVTLLLTQ